jgi:hypothetical protein
MARPRIISLSMVKNEQDIIEPFIRHNARFVDGMVILDNASVDDTRRIATLCARELGTIIVTDNDEFAYAQGERMTRMLHVCQSAFFADFILLLDADEFIGAPDRDALERALARIPPGQTGLLPWQNAVLTPAEAEAAIPDAPRCMRHYRTAETHIFHKAVLRLDGAHRPDLMIWQGNHGIVTTAGALLPSVVLDEVKLLHFPIRSRQQAAIKTVVGWAAYVANNPQARRAPTGRQWRDTFDRVVAGDLSPRQLAELSLRYGWAPADITWADHVAGWEPPSDYRRAYGSGAPGEPLSVIARSWERSLSGPLDDFPDTPAIDVPPLRFAMEKHTPASVLELGAGTTLPLLRHLGCENVAHADAAPVPGRVFDMVICTGAPDAEAAARHAGAIIVLAPAEPAPPRPIAATLAGFARLGWYPDLVDSLGMRALATWPVLRRELVLLRRCDPRPGEAAIAALVECDAKAPCCPEPGPHKL